MKINKIRKILNSLAYGRDPVSGALFEKDNPINNHEISDALLHAAHILKKGANDRDQNTKKISGMKKTALPITPDDLRGDDRLLYEELRAFRTKTAKELAAPAFIVCSNRTLVGIVINQPTTYKELLKVKGIGKVKAEKYGEEIIEIITKFQDLQSKRTDQNASPLISGEVNRDAPRTRKVKSKKEDNDTQKMDHEHSPNLIDPMTDPTNPHDNALQLLRASLDDSSANFREGQWEAIETLTQRRERLLVVQRTGWGKSVVYFLATKILRDSGEGLTLLISPLLALMRNQLLAAKRIGIRAATINSSNREEWEKVRKELFADQVDILLISPERLANEDFRERWLKTISDKIGLFVVDEAHCISDWGHDFRPDYLRVVRVLQALPPKIPVLATTATANDRVVEDVVNQLGPDLSVMRGALARESLRLQNIYLPSKAERMAWLAEKLPSIPGSGVIYALTIRDAQRLATWLQSKGIDAEAYWGGLPGKQRELLEDRLLENRIKAIVATTALGMGFDKPDMGFVIHFQRPGSVVHYYQQVGRAGRAVKRAYGILLSGDGDQEITDYFIRSAFPLEAHVKEVLGVLQPAEDGLSIPMMGRQLNLTEKQIRKVLKLLAVKSPAPVSKHGSRWILNPVPYVPDQKKIDQLTRIRELEQTKMMEYMQTNECLMVFLRRELNDPSAEPCGRCANCMGQPLLPEGVSESLIREANRFLRGDEIIIESRKQWPSGIKTVQGWSGKMDPKLLPERGRTLCIGGDAGWGDLVRRGKQVDGRFDDDLIKYSADLIQNRWHPKPFPTWVTCIPSQKHPALVPDLARRLSAALRLPFVEIIRKQHSTEPQKTMQNSYHQVKNLDGAFEIEPWRGIHGPVLLIDDMVDSRWTFMIASALLRSAGSGIVYPFALASVKTS